MDLYQVSVRPEWNTGSKLSELRGDGEPFQRHEQERREGQEVDRTRILSETLKFSIVSTHLQFFCSKSMKVKTNLIGNMVFVKICF